MILKLRNILPLGYFSYIIYPGKEAIPHMYTHPDEAEEADRRACQKMGLEVPRTTITGKQLIVLLLVTVVVCTLFKIFLG